MSDKNLIEKREKLTDLNDLPEGLSAEVVEYTKNAPEDMRKFYPNVFGEGG